MTKILSHEISKLGKIDIALHDKSEEFYNILESTGIIEHLKKLDHLGFIAKSHPGNNHKRWDYVMLQLYLLHKLKDSVFKSGLSSEHKVVGNQELSGMVILQIAILFSNMGHLPGTLSSEISLFNYLIKNDDRRNEFLSKINLDSEWKSYSENVFKNHDYYKMKYLIGLNYLKENITDTKINNSILKFFLKSIEEDEISFRKLKWLFFKVRQISFIYLDSFNSDFPFNVDITKLLLNTVNYSHLFNPNSSDYESFFDACETSLTKKIYVSEKSSIELFHNHNLFSKYLNDAYLMSLKNRIDFNNFLISFNARSVKPFEVQRSTKIDCYQFYLSKEDFEIFGNKTELFNYSKANEQNYKNLNELNSILNRNLTGKPHNVCLIHDQRKTMFFNNLLIDKNKIIETEWNQFLLNYFNLHLSYIKEFKYSYDVNSPRLKNYAIGTFQKSYCRKIFLQLFKIMFENSYKLSAFIKFENQPIIRQLESKGNMVYSTGFFDDKTVFLQKIEQLLAEEYIPADIKNNHYILNHILTNVTEIKVNFNAFYCLFPIEIDKHDLDPKKLYEQQNPESVKTITDVDLVIAIFNKSKFEFYLIEGKDSVHFKSQVKDDFLTKFKPNLKFPNSLPEIKYIRESNAKGGYICYKN